MKDIQMDNKHMQKCSESIKGWLDEENSHTAIDIYNRMSVMEKMK